MTERHTPEFGPRPDRDHSAEQTGGDQVGPLVRLAGPREAVSSDWVRRVKAVVHAEWRQQRRARARRTIVRWSAGAIATAALLVFGVRLAVREDSVLQGPARAVATIEVLSGAARLLPSSDQRAESALLQVGDSVREGDGVDTTSGGVAALRLGGGASVRIGPRTRLRLLSDSTMTLDEGTIYIDSGGSRGVHPLEVRTLLGVARDIGTRFEVRFNGSAVRVRVRDGLVRLAHSRESHDVKPGEELTLDDSGGAGRRLVAVHGTEWAWAAALAPPFELEGRSVREFVDWIGRENGWHVQFADAAVEGKSQTTTLHGSIQGLTAEEALSAVLPASGVRHRLENGVLLILGAGGMRD